jgi:hypothetical protein
MFFLEFPFVGPAPGFLPNLCGIPPAARVRFFSPLDTPTLQPLAPQGVFQNRPQPDADVPVIGQGFEGQEHAAGHLHVVFTPKTAKAPK